MIAWFGVHLVTRVVQRTTLIYAIALSLEGTQRSCRHAHDEITRSMLRGVKGDA
jgi:hypothetical protein